MRKQDMLMIAASFLMSDNTAMEAKGIKLAGYLSI